MSNKITITDVNNKKSKILMFSDKKATSVTILLVDRSVEQQKITWQKIDENEILIKKCRSSIYFTKTQLIKWNAKVIVMGLL